ncbi:unnamed protein product [Albugo candida]|uniref:Uncharacterized protein n=1 Tax=Albugo candida TaxID=65357 RepID=A0A024GRC0_9STRA|nr:unnamed protein product [Albugo candida]|eukprot:CCI49418.1 unnamed protein product [Albugo candida]
MYQRVLRTPPREDERHLHSRLGLRSHNDETSASASTGKEPQLQPKYIIDGVHLIRNYSKKRDAKSLLLRQNETPIEQGQHTALEQPSGGKHTAARNGIASTSSTNKGKMLWEKPSTDQDKQQDELATPSKRSDGPSATRSKNTNSNRKNKGNKKKNWRH